MKIDQFISAQVVDRLIDIVLLVGPDGSILDANLAAVGSYGYSLAELLALNIRDIRALEDQAEIRGQMSQAAESGVLFEAVHRRQDGAVFPVEVRSTRVEGDGETALLSIVRDISERRQAEDAVRTSELKFRTVADFAYDWEAWNAPDGSYRYVSPSCERITGHTAEEFMADPYLTVRITHPEDLEASAEHHRAAEAESRAKDLELDFRIVLPDGETRWISHLCTPVYGEDGEWLGRRESNRDITAQKQAEAALSASEEVFRAVFEGANDGIFLLSISGAIVALNPAMARMHGYSVEEMLSMDIGSLDEPETSELAPARLERLFAGESLSFEARHVCTDGRAILLEVSANRVVIGGEQYVLGFHRDITERRQAEQLLSVYAELLEASPAAITVHTPQGRFVYANEQTLKMHGYGRDEFLALDLHDLDVPEDAARIDERFRVTAALGENTFEVAHYRKDGTIIPLAVSNRVATWDGEEVLLSVATDITERKLAESELERHGAQLEGLLAERERNLEQLALSLSSVTEVVSQVVESRDPYTAGHQRRVAALAVRIAEDMGMSAPQIDEIRIAALLHDVGKISVPAEILSKPGKLSPLEFELIKGHSEAGYRILASANMGGEIAEVVYQHQERCDGSGYPRELCGDELLQGAKVLMVADVVEAMSSHRPYRVALGVDAALAEIERGAGRQYDAEVAEACRRVIDAGFVFEEL